MLNVLIVAIVPHALQIFSIFFIIKRNLRRVSLMISCIGLYKVKLMELTEYLKDDMYVKASNHVYRKSIGISMEPNCKHQLAKLYLFYYEYSYMRCSLSAIICS